MIPVRNGAEHLAEQLAALTRQTYDGAWDLVISDNGSTDDTRDVARSFSDRLDLRIADASGGIGPSYAHNVGIEVAKGEFICCCDADDIVDEGWIAALVEAAADYHLVGGKLNEDALNESAAWRPRVAATELHRTDWLPYAIGANLGIWRSTLESAGGWNEEFIHANDTELSYRVEVLGWRIGFAPKAIVRYRHRGDLKSLYRQFRNYGRQDPLIHRRFREYGHPRSSVLAATRRWARLTVGIPRLAFVRSARAEWVYTFAYSVGRIRGSIKYRTLFL